MLMQTYSGAYVNPVDPDMSLLTLNDFLVPMSRINRYNGHSRVPWNLLQHSFLVSLLVEAELRPYALCHDMHEVFIGDIATPVARGLESYGLSSFSLASLKKRLDAAIFKSFGLPEATEAVYDALARADTLALRIERNELFPGAGDPNENWPSVTRASDWHEHCFFLADHLGLDAFRTLIRDECPDMQWSAVEVRLES